MQIDGETRLIGILGDPVSHTLSPRMQNAAFDRMGLNIRYVPLHVTPERLPGAVSGLRAMEFIGANVTIPHKIAVTGLLDQLAETAAMAGAVNTIVNREGRLEGHNTDGEGFLRALKEAADLDIPSTDALIVGAGGAARAIAAALAGRGIKSLAIVNRTRARADELAVMLEARFPSLEIVVRGLEEENSDLIFSCKLLINATAVGMEGHLKAPPLAVDRLTKEHVVCDIVYASQETPLLVAAREKGATFMGGLGMLLHQGAASIHLWTGTEPPVQVMREAIESQ